MQHEAKDWQIRQHVNFSHNNHLHLNQSTAPRTTREAYGESVEPVIVNRYADLFIVLVAYSFCIGLGLYGLITVLSQ